jgi:hypothetical protein
MPSRFAAWLMPTDSANRNASSLNSSVYRRFGIVSFAIPSSVHRNMIKTLVYVETGQRQPEPHEEETEEEKNRQARAARS